MAAKPQLPRSLRYIAGIIGEEKTFELVKALGGTRVYVPREAKSDTLLVRAIGEEAAMKLGREMGGDHLELPLAGKAVTLWLHGRGLTNNEIARAQHCSAKTVHRRLAGVDIPLLDWAARRSA